MRTIDFELSSPFNYANGSGQEVECNFIQLREPTGKVSHLCCAVEGLVQSAVLKAADMLDDDIKEQAAEQAKKADENEIKDGAAFMAMISATGIEMDKLVLHFRELFKHVAYMGGEKLITSARLDDMSHKDLRRMIGTYAANFIGG